METEHAPLPWKIDAGPRHYNIKGADNRNIVSMTLPQLYGYPIGVIDASARLIFQACNSHYGLLGALKQAHCPCWVHNAAHTQDIEALRKIALWHARWNNTIRLPVIAKATQ